jgi:iron complex outermembrane receptor protein
LPAFRDPTQPLHLACLSLIASAADALQAQSSAPDAGVSAAGPSLREVTVTGNPLGAAELTVPVTSLQRDELTERARATWARRWTARPA